MYLLAKKMDSVDTTRIEGAVLKIIEIIIIGTIALISFYNQMDLTMFHIPFGHSTLLKLLQIMGIFMPKLLLILTGLILKM